MIYNNVEYRNEMTKYEWLHDITVNSLWHLCLREL